jgi:hypothetical protein
MSKSGVEVVKEFWRNREMAVSFKIGQHYRNRDGDFEVLALNGDTMKIRYADGRVIDSSITLQARIQERIQEEQGSSTEEVHTQEGKENGAESRKTDEIRDFVSEILQGLRQPWPPDITDKVYLNIESRRDRLSHYQKLVTEFGQPTVNISIGTYVKQLTGMESTGRMATPKSGLLSSYSLLAPSKSN